VAIPAGVEAEHLGKGAADVLILRAEVDEADAALF